MSGLEHRTTERDGTPAVGTAVIAFTGRSPDVQSAVEPKPAAASEWSPIADVDLLDERRAPVPAFPLELLGEPWRGWVSAAALAADAPVDYVAQSVLAAVAGGCGRGLWVWATPDWSEPLRLWLAAVGAPSSGKTPALEPMRRLLGRLESELIDGGDHARRKIVLRDGRFEAMVQALTQSPNGRLLWRDGATNCFSAVGGARDLRHLDGRALSILGTVEPDTVARTIQGGATVAARFLYAWPQPLPFRRPERDRRLEDGEVQDALRRILQMVGPTRALKTLSLEPSAARSFDAFHERLHPEIGRAEGLEAAWLGKGRGAVAALAGVLALMAWSTTKREGAPELVDAGSMERAIALWSGYYRPHAQSFFQRAVPSDVECQAGRVVRWLRTHGPATVSRRDVRRSALGQTVNASGADRVLKRLTDAGILRPLAAEGPLQRGRPALRWQVHPALVRSAA